MELIRGEERGYASGNSARAEMSERICIIDVRILLRR